jgi:CRISPR-associated endonuclease Csn1
VYIRGKNRDETNPFGEMKFYHDVKKALAGMAEWQQFVNDPYLLDEIGLVLTVEKSDEDIRRELGKLVLPTPISQMAVKALLLLSYAKFAYFSEKALRKLTPYVLQGQTHDKAVVSAGYSFNQVLHSTNCKLPPLSPEDAGLITNPVVKRAVSQTIKVINAIVRLHGLPYQIKVECARELAKNFKERGDIKKRQDENQVKNQQIAELLKEHGIVTPTGQQIVKYKLYTQQNGQCLYSGIPISLERLLSDEAVYEIDHIVPFSRCGDDGFGNKALVTREENQQKRNAIPYEVFGNNPEKWAAFKARVESLNLGSYKTRRCLAERVAEKDWSAHALKDTQYITRFLKEYIEKNLAFSDSSKKQRVLLPAGNITSYIGKRWGLSKDREQNVLHHARDAALVAVMTQGLIQRVSAYNKYGEIMQYHNTTKMLKDVLDFETGEILDEQKHEELKKRAFDHTKSTERHFPRPWDRFDEELKRRTRDISTEDLQNELRGFESYDDSFRLQIKPIFVSRMPNRKASGSAHEETRRSPKADEAGMRTVRVPLSKVQLKDLEKSPLKDTDQQLYKVLYERLKAYEDKPEKAFAEPVYKKDKHGNNAHQVRAIKIASKHPNSSGIYIDKGRAFVDNGSMVRLDVYRKENKKGRLEHFFVPVYTHQVSGSLPTKIMPSPKGFSDVDETFTKVASLYPNDYVRIHFENKTEEGYNVSSGVMSTINHAAPGKDRASLKETSPRSAVSIERHDIPILGNIF